MANEISTPSQFASTPVIADYLWQIAKEGRIFYASDADQNDLVTGQTSFADTTPTFLLDVPVGVVAVPLFMNLGQTGTVAGGAIDFIVEIDKVKRYSTGGTNEGVFNPRKSVSRTSKSKLYSNPTALTGFGARIWAETVGPDVSPAEGAVQGPQWRPPVPLFLEGPASFLVYTYAGTTGPTWFWSFGWAEFLANELGQ